MKTTRTFGRIIKHAREEAGITLRDMAAMMGISHPLISSVEVGRRRCLAERHWERIVEILPSLTPEELRVAHDNAQLVRLDPLEHWGPIRTLIIVFGRMMANGEVTREQARSILSILRPDTEADESVSAYATLQPPEPAQPSLHG